MTVCAAPTELKIRVPLVIPTVRLPGCDVGLAAKETVWEPFAANEAVFALVGTAFPPQLLPVL